MFDKRNEFLFNSLKNSWLTKKFSVKLNVDVFNKLKNSKKYVDNTCRKTSDISQLCNNGKIKIKSTNIEGKKSSCGGLPLDEEETYEILRQNNGHFPTKQMEHKVMTQLGYVKLTQEDLKKIHNYWNSPEHKQKLHKIYYEGVKK